MTTHDFVTRWPETAPLTEIAILEQFADEGLSPTSWGNKPGTVYGTHTHTYHKVLYVVEGSITFGLPDLDVRITLYPGDRLDLPPNTRHNALVGARGVVCLEAQRD